MQCDSDGPVNTFANAGSHSLFTDGLDHSRGAGGRDRRVRRDSDGVDGEYATRREERAEGKTTGDVELTITDKPSPIWSDRLKRLEQQQARHGVGRQQQDTDWSENPFFRNI